MRNGSSHCLVHQRSPTSLHPSARPSASTRPPQPQRGVVGVRAAAACVRRIAPRAAAAMQPRAPCPSQPALLRAQAAARLRRPTPQRTRSAEGSTHSTFASRRVTHHSHSPAGAVTGPFCAHAPRRTHAHRRRCPADDRRPRRGRGAMRNAMRRHRRATADRQSSRIGADAPRRPPLHQDMHSATHTIPPAPHHSAHQRTPTHHTHTCAHKHLNTQINLSRA